MELGTIFSGLSSAAAVTNAIRGLLRNTKGIRRALLLELQKNINLIYLHARGGAPVDKVIERLEVARYEAASQTDFDFNSFNRRKVQAQTVREVPALHPYVGWTTEELFESIYLKIHGLKSLVAINAGDARVRKDVRLLNVLRLMLLLLKHIKR